MCRFSWIAGLDSIKPPPRKCSGPSLDLDLAKVADDQHSIVGFECYDNSFLYICVLCAALLSVRSPQESNMFLKRCSGPGSMDAHQKSKWKRVLAGGHPQHTKRHDRAFTDHISKVAGEEKGSGCCERGPWFGCLSLALARAVF